MQFLPWGSLCSISFCSSDEAFNKVNLNYRTESGLSLLHLSCICGGTVFFFFIRIHIQYTVQCFEGEREKNNTANITNILQTSPGLQASKVAVMWSTPEQATKHTQGLWCWRGSGLPDWPGMDLLPCTSLHTRQGLDSAPFDCSLYCSCDGYFWTLTEDDKLLLKRWCFKY